MRTPHNARSLAVAGALSVAALLLTQPCLAAGGGGGAPAGGGGGAQSAKAVAAQLYKSGLRNRDKALGYEQKAVEDESARAKWQERAHRSYRRAARDFKKAVSRDREFFHAFNELGYAQRKLGDYDAALEAYDRALEIEPRFGDAIEYRAEAYLGLGRLDDVRREYLRLFAGSRKLAAQLLTAMEAWSASPPEKPAIAPADAERFVTWVRERRQLADQVDAKAGTADPWPG